MQHKQMCSKLDSKKQNKKILEIHFIFHKRHLFGFVFYDPEIYILNEAPAGRNSAGCCQTKTHSPSQDWWPSPQ